MDSLKYFVLIFAVLFVVLFFRGSWIEPDSYAFLSRACDTSDWESPAISQWFFDSLPCNFDFWILVQVILWALSILVIIIYFMYWKIPISSLAVLGFSLSAIYALLAFEDDYLLIAPFFLFSHWLLAAKPSLLQRVQYALFIFAIGLLVWKGAWLVGSIVLLASFHPVLALGPVIYYMVENGFGYSWGGSIEGMVFNGWTVFFPLIVLLFHSKKEKLRAFIVEHWKYSGAFVVLLLLGWFQIKWGLYSALLTPFIFWKVLDEKNFEKLIVLGSIVLLLALIGIGLTKPPFESHWNVLERAVEFESTGNIVYIRNSFGFTKWGFEYVGGHPVYPLPPDGNYYYLGDPLPHCMEVFGQDMVALNYCETVPP